MRIFSLASVILATLATIAAHADTITFASTAGVTTYTYGLGNGSLTGTSGTAVAYQNIAYATPLAGSQWVSTDSNGGNGASAIVNYTNSFNLLAGETYSGSFSFMADNYAGVIVNGVEVFPISAMTGFNSPVTINLLSSYFKSGVNTITLEDANTGGPAAANFSGTLTGTAAVTPEPSTLILLGTGLLGVAGAARRRFSAV